MTRFTPKLGQDPAYMKDPDERSQPYEFSLTKDERSVAAFGTCHLEDYRRRQNEKDAASEKFTPGLVVKRLDPEELSDDERRSFNL